MLPLAANLQSTANETASKVPLQVAFAVLLQGGPAPKLLSLYKIANDIRLMSLRGRSRRARRPVSRGGALAIRWLCAEQWRELISPGFGPPWLLVLELAV
jgi:hypothetical protein